MIPGRGSRNKLTRDHDDDGDANRGSLVNWLGRGHKNGVARTRIAAPLARTEDVIVEDFGDEVLIYDRNSDYAHCLGREAAMVWRVCDGSTPAAAIATALGFDRETVDRALDELDESGLLDSIDKGGLTRREATIKMAKVGGLAAAAPMIYSIMAPTPALAASQAYCLTVTNCFSNGSGCSTCFKAGCVCCGAGSSGNAGAKLCTADCSCSSCNANIIHCHCSGVTGNESTCTAGPNGSNYKCYENLGAC